MFTINTEHSYYYRPNLMLSVWVWTKFYWVYHWMVTQSSSFEHWTEKLLWYLIMGLWFGRLAAENWTKIYRYQLPHMSLVPLHMYFSTNWCFHKFNFLQRVTFCLCILFAVSLQKVFFFTTPVYRAESDRPMFISNLPPCWLCQDYNYNWGNHSTFRNCLSILCELWGLNNQF